MPIPLRVLIVSDREGDALQLIGALRQSDYVPSSERVDTAAALRGAPAHRWGLLLATDESAPHRPALQAIPRAAERGGALTHQLLAFSRGRPFTPRTVQLNTLIVHMEKMLSRLIGEDVELITVAAAEPANVRTDPGQLEQVVMNVVVNARDAMPGGGKLIIETSNAQMDRTHAGPNVDLKPGSYVVLAISDTGMGMDPETVTHLFEPGLRSVAWGKGTGLGLATAYGIVKQSGGAISVYSEPGRGTTVKFYLPSAEAK